MPRALITGVTGQDGWYLTELLLRRGYQVVGTSRRPDGVAAQQLLQHARAGTDSTSQFGIAPLDIADPRQVDRLLQEFQPHEIYNLAALSHVGRSFAEPLETLTANAGGVVTLLEAARRLTDSPAVRIYQASSSEVFGACATYPQTEETSFRPRSPYACAKACAFQLCVLYRESYGLFVSNGILFNHESPRRPADYVMRKITRAAARIAAGLDHELLLGTLNVGRDWGFAGDYTDAMWRMLQHDVADDFVVATNQWRSLEELLETAFSRVQLRWQDHVRVDSSLSRPAEVTRLQGDYTKAERLLGWRPTTSFSELVNLMVDADVEVVRHSTSTTAQRSN